MMRFRPVLTPRWRQTAVALACGCSMVVSVGTIGAFRTARADDATTSGASTSGATTPGANSSGATTGPGATTGQETKSGQTGPSAQGTAPAQLAPSTDASAALSIEIAQEIANLNHGDFVVRELAEKRLRELGLPAVPALRTATQAESPEVALRATEILADFYRKATFPEASSVEDALSELRKSPGTVGQVASRAWNSQAAERDVRTVQQLSSLGARVQFLPKEDATGFARGNLIAKRNAATIQFIVIGRNWKGGDEGLKLLERLSQPDLVQIYHVNGATVSETAMDMVADLGFKVDQRGAFLGISGGGGAVLGPQSGCLVGAVTAGSPAAKAGIQELDRIKQFGDEEIEDFQQLIDKLKTTTPGDKVDFRIERNGESITLKVDLGDW